MLCITGDILGKAFISIFLSKLHHEIETFRKPIIKKNMNF